MGPKKKGFEKRKVFIEDLKELTDGRMTDRKRELVPYHWSLVSQERWPLHFVWKNGILNSRVSAEDN